MPPIKDAIEPAPNVPHDNHLSTRTLIIAGIALSLLAFILLLYIQARTALPSSQDIQGTWGGAGGTQMLVTPTAPTQSRRISTQELLSGQIRDERILIPSRESTENLTFTDDPVSMLSLLTQLTQPQVSADDHIDFDAYSLIPQGLTTVSTAPKKRSTLQQELFEYGNTVGSYIRGFEDSHPNMLRTLKDAYEDRDNSAKTEAAAQIGTDYIRLGTELQYVDPVPESVKAVHDALVEAHKVVGRNLRVVARAKTDTEFLNAIDTYNTSVERYATQFVALAELFGATQVQFTSNDPGSVFTFTGAMPSF